MKRTASFLMIVAAVLAGGIFSASALGQTDLEQSIGYAVVTPTYGDYSGLRVYQTLYFRQATGFCRSDVLPARLTTSALFSVELAPLMRKDLAFAIANPNDRDCRLTFTVRRYDGAFIGSRTLFIPPKWQRAEFLTEIFSEQPDFPLELTGTVEISSDRPIGITALNFSAFHYSVVPGFGFSEPFAVPEILPSVGGPNSSFFPIFVQGGGWITEFVLINRSAEAVTVRIDIFSQKGGPMKALLNERFLSTHFGLRVRPHGVLIVRP